MTWLADPKVFNYVIMSLYGLNVVTVGMGRKDCGRLLLVVCTGDHGDCDVLV